MNHSKICRDKSMNTEANCIQKQKSFRHETWYAVHGIMANELSKLPIIFN